MLISSIEDCILDQFIGYAYINSDLIIGQDGFTKYIQQNKTFEKDSDGCYVLVETVKKGHVEIEADWKGYKTIFYYSKNDYWAVSDSFEELCNFSKSKGWDLSVREASLEQWRNNLVFSLQLTSNRTPYNEIFVLGSYEKIVVVDGKMNTANKLRTIETSNYREALEQVLSKWISRLKTILLNENMTVRLDLSGGLDTRVVFSLFLKTIKMSNLKEIINSGRVYINSNKIHKDDYNVATNIADTYGLILNNTKNKREYRRISSLDGYTSWRKNNLGRYAPNILPLIQQGNQIVTFPGTGGESHRPFYTKFGNGELITYLQKYKKYFRTEDLYFIWLSDVIQSVESALKAQPDYDIPMSIRHYREFRARHHTSKMPENEIMGVFMGSKYFYELSLHAGLKKIEDGQILFDVMYNCDKQLPFMNYDSKSKLPTELNKINFTNLYSEFNISPGTIYKGTIEKNECHKKEYPNIILFKEVKRSLENKHVQAYIGDEYRKLAYGKLNFIKNYPEKNHHSEGAFLHYISLSDLIIN